MCNVVWHFQCMTADMLKHKKENKYFPTISCQLCLILKDHRDHNKKIYTEEQRG